MAGAIVGRLVYGAMFPLMGIALWLVFRRVRALHPERFPRKGAVLLVANHPATWTDVLVLNVVLRRRLHFLALEELFRPWPRRALLRLFGALPLWRSDRVPDAASRNGAIFRRCGHLFDHGEVVAVFPEGRSRVDRGLLPLRHGAARLARAYVTDGAAPRALTIVPVGLHYSDRARFRSEVTIGVGTAIQAADSSPADLTDRVAEALRAQVVTYADPRDARVVAVAEPLMTGGAPLPIEHAMGLARAVADLRVRDPESYRRLERAARRMDRIARALRVRPAALRPRSRGERARAWTYAVAGALPALAGLAIHAAPAALTAAATRRYASEPSRVGFARITAGAVFVPAGYAALLWALVAARAPLLVVASAPALFVALGLHAAAYASRTRLELDRARFHRAALRRPGLGRRALAAGLDLRREVARLAA